MSSGQHHNDIPYYPAGYPLPLEPEVEPRAFLWARRAMAAGAVALAVFGVSKAGDIVEAADIAFNGASIERCLDKPLAADDIPKYPTSPEYKPPNIPPVPDMSEYSSYEAYNKAIDDYFKSVDDALAYKSPEEIAHEKALASYNAQMSPPDIKLKRDVYGVEGQPVWLYDIQSKVEAATVIVETGDGHGTGFAVRDETSGDIFVVTAAHVVGTDGMKQISITKPDATEATVTGGCLIYDEGDMGNARFADFETDSVVEADVAVLRVNDATGLQPLTITGQTPKRGDWVGLVNHQGYAPNIDYPSSYDGLVVHSWPSEKSYDILTGFGSVNTNSDAIFGGASGGPVVNKDGGVVGLSYTALKEEYYNGADDLGYQGIVMSQEDADALKLREGGVMKTSVILEAIKSLSARPDIVLKQ